MRRGKATSTRQTRLGAVAVARRSRVSEEMHPGRGEPGRLLGRSSKLPVELVVLRCHVVARFRNRPNERVATPRGHVDESLGNPAACGT